MKEKEVEYEKPMVAGEDVFEQTALSCDSSPYANSQYDLKDSSRSCGYSDS